MNMQSLSLPIIVGSRSPEWGHTFVAQQGGLVYALRSLPGGSQLCLYHATTLHPMAQYSTPGEHSCHISLLPRQAVVADYTSGTLSLFALGPDGVPTGDLLVETFHGEGPCKERQASSHVHSTLCIEGGKWLRAVDLGGDTIYAAPIAEGAVQPHSFVPVIHTPAGCGPRCCVLSPCGHYLYVVTELTDEVLVYAISLPTDGIPAFTLLQRCCFNSCHPQGGGQAAVSSNGQRLYVSSRVQGTAGSTTSTQPDGIATYSIDSQGLLTAMGFQPTAAHPRHCSLSSNGRHLLVACRDGHCIQDFALHPTTGLPLGSPTTVAVPSPTYVAERQAGTDGCQTPPLTYIDIPMTVPLNLV